MYICAYMVIYIYVYIYIYIYINYQVSNQKFFRAAEVSENKGISINI